MLSDIEPDIKDGAICANNSHSLHWCSVERITMAAKLAANFVVYQYSFMRALSVVPLPEVVNSSPAEQKGHHFADDNFKRIFVNEMFFISMWISMKLVSKGPIHDIPALVQIMAWRRPGDKPLSEPMLAQFTNAYMRHKGGWISSLGPWNCMSFRKYANCQFSNL